MATGGSWTLAPTFQPFLAQGDHFIELPLYETVPFIFIQPLPTWEGLLNPSERAVNHHLEKEIGKVSLNILLLAPHRSLTSKT